MGLWNQRDWLRDDHDSTEAKRALPWAVTARIWLYSAMERGRLKGVSHGRTQPCPGEGDAACGGWPSRGSASGGLGSHEGEEEGG